MSFSKNSDPNAGDSRGFAVPLGAARAGRLEFVRGASLVTIDADLLLQDLCRAQFQGAAPKVHARDGTVTIQYRHFSLAEWAKYALLWGRLAASITLNGSIPWQIMIRGGVSKLSADLREIQLSTFDVRGGASEVTVLLPRPAGAVPVRVAGGASNVTLRRPAGVAVGIQVRSGASKLIFDDQHFGAIGGHIRLTTPDYRSATNRYYIEVAGGASRLTIDTLGI